MRLTKAEERCYRDLADRYARTTGSKSYDTGDVVRWAQAAGELEMPPDFVFKFHQERLSTALNSDRLRLEDGREVRIRLNMAVTTEDEEGKPVQRHLWAHVDDAPYEFLLESFRQRFKAISDDVGQFRNDLAFVNERLAARGQRPMQFNLPGLLVEPGSDNAATA